MSTPEKALRKLKIGVYSMDGIGHLAACIGIIQPLLDRGHDIFFLLNESFKGQLERYGIREIHMIETSKKLKNHSNEDNENIAGKNGQLFLKSGFLSGLTSYEKATASRGGSFLKQLYDTLLDFETQIEDAINNEKPDLLILDHFFLPASFYKSNIPYAFIHSCSPLMMYSEPTLPPAFSGYPTESDPETWKPFMKALKENFEKKFHTHQNNIFKEAGINVPEYKTMVYMSPYLNIYAYPLELDYHKYFKPPENCFRIDAFSRDEPESDQPYLPDIFLDRPDDVGLIYFSLGSMGGADLELMQKLTGWFKESKHRFIVSKGPRAEEYSIGGDNVYSSNFLPQTRILPLCDLVITHGGNNSTTETLFAGKPMIILPLFADQYDNGTRVEETGCGVQFNPYHVTKEQLFTAIDKIFTDKEMILRTKKIRERIIRDNRKLKLAIRLEELAQ